MKLGRLIKRCLSVVFVSIVVTVAVILIQGLQHTAYYKKTRSAVSKPTSHWIYNISTSVPVLLWWDSVYSTVDDVRTCGDLKCHVTNNKGMQRYPGSKVFLFYGSNFKPYNLPLPRNPDDVWALIHEESPRNAYLFSHNGTLEIFNVTSSYNRKSNYPITTQWLQCSDWLWDTEFLVSLEHKNRLRRQGMAPILYLHSDCGVPSDRDHFVKMLQKYINVDSYGTCVKNKELPERLRFQNTMALLDDVAFFRWASRYKFTLSMENYVCDDYVTEKLWRPLRLGSIPIVFGAPNVKNLLPDNNSAIIIDDYSDIEQLAEYIYKVDTNDRLYQSYLQFKIKPLQNNFLREQLIRRDWNPTFCKNSGKKKYSHQSIFEGFECYLCRLAHTVQSERKLGWKATVFQANSSHYSCPAPKQFNERGKYNVYSDVWSEEWNYGKHEARVMQSLIKDNKIVSRKEFERLVNEDIKSAEFG